MTPSQPIDSPEMLVAHVDQCLRASAFDDAVAAVQSVDSDFAESFLAHWAAGIAWETSFIDAQARGSVPDITRCERAVHHYRRALELNDEEQNACRERLAAVLFIKATQDGELEDFTELDGHLALLAQATDDASARGGFLRQRAISATARARKTMADADWLAAEQAFAASHAPDAELEALFHYYYKGLTKRTLAELQQDAGRLRDAADCFRAAHRLGSIKGLEYLLADCLLQIGEPTFEDVLDMKALVPSLTERFPDDPLVIGLDKRWHLRKQLLREQGLLTDDQP